MSAAFDEIKAALARAAMIHHPSKKAPLSIATDASDSAVGAVLQQFVAGAFQPLGFFSKALKPAERKVFNL